MKNFDDSQQPGGKDRRKKEAGAPGKRTRNEGVGCDSEERRLVPRLTLQTSFPSSFQHKGKSKRCLMINLSSRGAKFRMLEQKIKANVEIGQEIELDILTPFGASSYKGVVVWVGMVDGFNAWGVSFSGKLQDDNDPLQNFLESAF